MLLGKKVKTVAITVLVVMAALVGYLVGLSGGARSKASESLLPSRFDAPALAGGPISVPSDQSRPIVAAGDPPQLYAKQDPSTVIDEELEALRQGDVSAVANGIVFSPEAKVLMDLVVASAPAELVHQYPTPELLAAFIFCGAQRIEGFRIESTTFPHPDVALLRVAYKFESEPEWRTEGMALSRTPDGWRRVIGISETRRVAAIIGFGNQ